MLGYLLDDDKPYYNKWWFVNQPIKKMLVGLPGKTTLQCTMFFAMFFFEKAGEWYLYEFDRDDNINTY